MGSRLQALKDARDNNSGSATEPIKHATIQALENARDYQPVTNEESERPADGSEGHAGETAYSARRSPSAADNAETPAGGSQDYSEQSQVNFSQQPQERGEQSQASSSRRPQDDYGESSPANEIESSPRQLQDDDGQSSPTNDDQSSSQQPQDYNEQSLPANDGESSSQQPQDDDEQSLPANDGKSSSQQPQDDDEQSQANSSRSGDIQTGGKRKRRINSSEAESDHEPPARQNTAALSSQAVLTFGTAPGTTGVQLATNKAVNRRTANDYANTPAGKLFSCPVPQCQAPITEAWTVVRFYKHMEDDMHTTYFYQNGSNSHKCPFGCHKGFLNDFALHRHIQQKLCEEADKLFTDIKICQQCDDRSGKTPDIIGALDHFEDDHHDLISVNGSPYVCALCNIGFPTKELLWGHLALDSQISTSHTAVAKANNMWYPSPTIA